MSSSFRLAIVGGGFAGTALACQIQPRLAKGAEILLFEASGQAGPGIAYATRDPGHLLNVPAAGMSLWPERPADFVEWLARQPDAPVPPETGPHFVPRLLYGRYLAEQLAATQAAPGARLQVLAQSVQAVQRQETGFLLCNAAGESWAADAVVLALGGFAADPGRPPLLAGDPWDPASLEGLEPEAPVMLLGAGLTMVDMLLSLRRQGHHGPLVAVSRHGWAPLSHVQGAAVPPWPVTAETPAGPAGWMRRLRQEAARAAAAGQPWQAVIDGFRPQVQRVWRGWSLAQRRSFLRHGRTLWNLHRHRLAPQVAAVLGRELAAGGLRLLAGRLEDWAPQGDGVEARLRRRGGALQALTVARILVCTGPDGGSDWRRLPPMLDLLTQGLASRDPAGFGPQMDPDSLAVLDAAGQPVPGLYLMGPLTRVALWESTAVPELRAQAAALARSLAG